MELPHDNSLWRWKPTLSARWEDAERFGYEGPTSACQHYLATGTVLIKVLKVVLNRCDASDALLQQTPWKR